ncbi:MAG: hypothetical protein IPJ00_07615 [Saprospirales bacterium]|nr:hypothetical protein [Saprospirales bacterium]
MRKLTLLAFLFSLHAIPSTAQMGDGPDTLAGNEWIDFDRSYFKTLLAQDGIYRISYSELSSLLPANVEANRIRLFYFGEEIPIYTSTEGPMGNGDFIEFFGKKNRSEMDRFLYQDSEALFNPHLSLFTDSSAYFLTWNDIISGERYQPQLNEMSDLPPKEEFYWEKTLLSSNSNFTAKNKIPEANKAEHSFFEDAEGFCYQNPVAYPAFSVSHPYTAYSDSVPFTVRYTHLSADVPAPVTKTIKLNGVSYASDQFSSFEPRENTFLIPPSLLNAPINLSINGGNQTCMASAEITYPRQFNAAGNAVYIFSLENSDSKKYIEVSNFAHGGVAPVLYDITNEFRLETVLQDGLVKFALPASAQDRKLVLIHPENGPKTPSPLQPVEFIDYSEEDGEFLIIFNKALAVDGNGTDQVQAYAEYRANSPYYPYSTYTFEIQQLYDQFAYGLQRHTMAIRNFTWYIHKNWSEPKYLLLIGKGLEYQSIRSASQVSAQQNVSFFLPTFGQTGADNLLVSPIGSVDPYFVIGRLPVVSADELRIYLDKVKSFEAAPFGGGQTIQEKAWMKRLVHLGGGREEQPIIQSYLQGMEQVIENNRFGGQGNGLL